MWDRSKLFLRRAGTVILGINILLWFLATYPRSTTVQQEFAAKRAAIEASTPPNLTDAGLERMPAKKRFPSSAGRRRARTFDRASPVGWGT